MENCYSTIKEYATDEIVEKRSRFIGYVKPVETEEQAIEFINQIKAKHHDAKHNVFAYVIRKNAICRYSDDGEPQGTAGQPILKILQGEQLVDCVVVVTRYFGGILLGTGGLVRAYTDATLAALKKTQRRYMKLYQRVTAEYNYDFHGRFTPLVFANGGRTGETVYQHNISAEVFIPAERVEDFKAALVDISRGTVTASAAEYIFLETEEV